MDEHAVDTGLAELVRQLQQLLGDSTGHIGEHQVGEGLVSPAQPLRERLQERLGHLGTASEPGA